MTLEDVAREDTRKQPRIEFDRHSPEFRERFREIAQTMHEKCPVAWNDTYGGYWVAGGSDAVFELARCPHIVNEHDIDGTRRGYKGISIPTPDEAAGVRGGFLEMDGDEHRTYRTVINPYLSPAAVKRWLPFIDEVVRACLDEKIEGGEIDFVDDLANVVPAVITLAMVGIPIQKWALYSEPVHAFVYTKPDSPDRPRVMEKYVAMGMDLINNLAEIRENPRPGLIEALARTRIDGEVPPDMELLGVLNLLIGGGFDTTTALTAHSLEWLSENPSERARLIRDRDALLDGATEEFLRFYTPAPGDGRTMDTDIELMGVDFKEGDRVYISWAFANRDPILFEQPDRIILDRKQNRHFAFGLGAHRCIGSNLARVVFKSMLAGVLERMPDYRCDPEHTVHYETIGVIQGMRKLPATFTPAPRVGAGLDDTLDRLQRICEEQGLARPITEFKGEARIT
ncbi:cytochrome P450 [Mycolicibacterium holsaticum]|uniref:cytochrome P450 n=1 Tax=Mycolicibacterium holsaticum TaxID=152142 RepID=UPI001C7CA006|nr:cytochrome P450 [Mycolicibacterium holsaticum]MDA4106801.1 cytochrome P450 [Mycolicibacterium holsaticum DSM 44478 = JCM 12374]QZA14078.1 cytochrome P450 [Mycolicibacterium holsaticum DSM 44478 = JCM 12374]UNC08465.1 cytochrome P450 [Mycolicibacterium holsaticum DSM 44478 = JCM 12374]